MSHYSLLIFPYTLICIALVVFLAGKKSIFSNAGKGLTWTLIALPVVYFFYVLGAMSTNLAFIDDFNLLDSFYRMLYAEEPLDKIKAFFEQVNEHRFAFERVMMFGIHLVAGHPDIKLQIITGNLFLVGIAWLLYRFFNWSGQPIVYFLPVVFLLFNLSFYENANWGIAAIQNTPLIFFALLTVWFLAKNTPKGNLAGLFSAVVTTFVSGSGLSVWIIGVILLVMDKRYRFLAVWIGTAVVIGIFYFTFDYVMYPRDRSNLWHHPLANLSFLFSFLGALFHGDYHHGLEYRFYADAAACVILGAVLFLISLRWFLETFLNRIQKYRQAQLFLTGTFLFLLATGSMLVISRPVASWVFFGGENLSQRYLIFSAVLCAAAYLAVIYLSRKSLKQSRLIFLVSLLFAVGVNVVSYYRHLPSLFRQKAMLELDPYYVETHGMLLTSGEVYGDKLFWNHPTAFTDLLGRLKEKGLYQPGQNFDASVLKKTPATGSPWNIRIKVEESIGFAGRRSPVVYLTATGSEQPRITYFILQSENGQFVLPSVPEKAKVSEIFSRWEIWGETYGADFRYLKFPPDTYRILIVEENGRLWDSGQTLQLDRLE